MLIKTTGISVVSLGEQKVTYRLFGHYAGRTITFGSYRFVEGDFTATVPRLTMGGEDALQLMDNWMNQWGAKRITEGANDGRSDLFEEAKRPNVGQVGSESKGPSAESASPPVDRSNTNHSSVELGPKGNGENPVDFQGDRIRAAVEKLDHVNDSHWTTAGKPSLPAVEKIMGYTGLTRAKVDAASPNARRKRG